MQNILCLFFLFFFTASRAQSGQSLNTQCLLGQLDFGDNPDAPQPDCLKCQNSDTEEFCFDSEVLNEFCGDVPQRPCPAMIVQTAGVEAYCGKCFKRVPLFACEDAGCRETFIKVVRAINSRVLPSPGMYVTGNVFAETCTTCLTPPNYICKDPSEGGPLVSCISRSTEAPTESSTEAPTEAPTEASTEASTVFLRQLQLGTVPTLPENFPDSFPSFNPCALSSISRIFDFSGVEFEYVEVPCDSGPEPTEPPTTTTPAPPVGSFFGEASCGTYEELNGSCGDDLTIVEWETPCGDWPINSCPMLISSSASEYDDIVCGKCYNMAVEFHCADKPSVPICSESYSIYVTKRGEFNSGRRDSSNIHLPSHAFREVCPAGCFEVFQSPGQTLPQTEFSCMFSILDTCMDLPATPPPPGEGLAIPKGLPIADVCEIGMYKKIINEIIGATNITLPGFLNFDPTLSSRVTLTEVDCSEGPPTTEKATTNPDATGDTGQGNTTTPVENTTVDESDHSATAIAWLAFSTSLLAV